MSTVIPTPQFPDVPQQPGVPQLIRSPFAGAGQTPLPILSPAIETFLFRAFLNRAPVWGVFNAQNQKVIGADSVQSLDNRNEWKIPDFPIQDGSFASYNKVIVPFEVSVRLMKTGTLSDRQLFLQQIKQIAGDTNLYTIVSPEVSYLNCNIMRYEVMRRDQRDAYALWEVDLYFRQINQVAAQYSTTQVLNVDTSNAQQPAALPPVNQGLTQPGTPTAAMVTAAKGFLAGVPH